MSTAGFANVSREHTNVGQERLRATIHAQNTQWELFHARHALVIFSDVSPQKLSWYRLEHWPDAYVDVIVCQPHEWIIDLLSCRKTKHGVDPMSVIVDENKNANKNNVLLPLYAHATRKARSNRWRVHL